MRVTTLQDFLAGDHSPFSANIKMTWDINLDKQTAKQVGVTPDTFQWVCTNPKDIPPDDLDDKILGRMVEEADAMYQWYLKLSKG